MDSSILEGVLLAYTASPSSSLAKIIVKAYVDAKDIERAAQYLEALDTDLELELVAGILTLAVQTQHKNAALNIFSQCEHTPKALIQYLLDKEQRPGAIMIYAAIIEFIPELASDEANDLIHQAAPTVKPKLRVIEKKDYAEVTDLTRYKEATTNFDDVVGLSDVKKQIHKKIILPFQKPSLFQRFKKKAGGGVLLFGPPGCGKTLLARATAGQCNAQFFNIEVSDVLDMYIGESEQKLHAIFEKARAQTPSVLFFDEFEALAGKREHARNSSTSNTISQFLTELDGFAQNNHGVLVLASTNVPWNIDPAFLRPGRFDRMFFIPPPDAQARSAILQHHMDGRPCQADIDFTFFAQKTGGFSGADLANLIEMAADEAIEDSIAMEAEQDINTTHLKTALKDCRATTTEWLTTARNYARYANDGGRYNDVIDFLKKHGK